jgi:hypothetical protein
MHVLWILVGLIVDVILALATLLGLQGFTEFALGLVLGCLFVAGFVTSAHEANCYRCSSGPEDCSSDSLGGGQLVDTFWLVSASAS